MNISQWIHFGVIGVIECFKWIYENRPDSIFEEPMLAKLKEWHEKYNLFCGLYVFEQSGSFNIRLLQNIYWKELMEESSWLKFSWHGISNENCTIEDYRLKAASLERVHDLIVKKTKKSSWGQFARIHRSMISGNLVEKLENFGIRVILVGNPKEYEDLWKESEKIVFQKKRFMKVNSLNYCQADLCFDEISEGLSIDELLCLTEHIMSEYITKPYVDVFFHESKFNEIISGIDEYWKNFKDIRIPLVMNCGILIEKNIYFTTHNTKGLYTFNIDTENLEHLLDLPGYSSNIFPSFVFFNESIWFIPISGENILVYDIKKKKVIALSLSFLLKERATSLKFDGYFLEEKYLWLMSKQLKSILKINMVQKSVEILDEKLLDTKKYNICFQNEKKEVVDIVSYRECGWRFLYKDGWLLQLSIERKIMKKIRLSEIAHSTQDWYAKQKNYRIDKIYTIADYIFDTCNNIQEQWTEIRGNKVNLIRTNPLSIGEQIYEMLL